MWTWMGTAFLGRLMPPFFPMDARSAAGAVACTTHRVLAGLGGVGAMSAVLLTDLRLNGQAGQSRCARRSFVTMGVVFVFHGLTPASTAQASSILDMLERITSGSFLQWVLVLGWKSLRVPD